MNSSIVLSARRADPLVSTPSPRSLLAATVLVTLYQVGCHNRPFFSFHTIMASRNLRRAGQAANSADAEASDDSSNDHLAMAPLSADASARWKIAAGRIPLYDGDPLRLDTWCSRVELVYSDVFGPDAVSGILGIMDVGLARLAPDVRSFVLADIFIESWEQLKMYLHSVYPPSLGRSNLLRDLQAPVPQRYQAATLSHAIACAEKDVVVCPSDQAMIISALLKRLPEPTRFTLGIDVGGNADAQFTRLRRFAAEAMAQHPPPSWAMAPQGAAAFAAAPLPAAELPAPSRAKPSSKPAGMVSQGAHDKLARKHREATAEIKELRQQLALLQASSSKDTKPPAFPSRQ